MFRSLQELNVQPTRGVTIVTGATGGIGRATAQRLAQAKRPLILSDLHAEALGELGKSIEASCEVSLVPGDITEPEHLRALVTALRGQPIAAMAHTAGVSPSMTRGDRVMKINYEATKRLAEAALPHMAPGSALVVVSSCSAQLMPSIVQRLASAMDSNDFRLLNRWLTMSSKVAYPLSKLAVQRYVSRMAAEFGKRQARIVSLSPGLIDTPMGRRELEAERSMRKMLEFSAAQRLGEPDEIASVIEFLLSPSASFISGTDILVDGGVLSGVAQAGGVTRLL